ncbi:WD repeat-containing protein 43 [Maniola hyperantus]|uniref:WD repeat-containing protein 43 n=1 Tax=Aphantopus hyperantus TaxID=2795564 RepID=UPI00156A24F4|nr:WD repeat-containing protein 43 [Maniola hyperantus]
MAVAAFSEDGKYYSVITQDGRIKIWDTETNILKQEYTPDLHLSSPPTCLQWISVSLSASPQKGARRKSVSESEQYCLALGTTSGKILIYSVSQAKAETVLNQKESNCKVSTLDWHRKYGLFSCTVNNCVQEWNLQSGTVSHKYNVKVVGTNKQLDKISAIKLVPHSQETPSKFLITASLQIRLWRLHNSNAEVVKCLGHNAAPGAYLTLATLNKACWLIEGSQTERLLSFWDVTITEEQIPQTNQQNGDGVTPKKKQRKKSISAPVTPALVIPAPAYNFVLEDAPRILDVSLTEEDESTRLSLAAATRSGVVHYYGLTLNGESTKPIKPTLTIQVTTEDAQPLPLQCCRLPTSGDLLLGYTNGPALVFEKIVPDLKTKTQVLIRGIAKPKGPKSNKKQTDLSTAEKDVTYVEPMGGVSRKRAMPGGKVEVSMEARLENLTVDISSRSRSAVSHNLTKLLIQGLHSHDRKLILLVLQKDDPAVASSTVSHLPPDYIPALIEQLVEMAHRRTSQCASVCTWLTAILRVHSALLLATVHSATNDRLSQMLAIFTHRRSHLCQLLNLKGRLDLTMAQRNAASANVDQQPVLDYNDSSSDSEAEAEPEVGVGQSSGSEHSWSDEEGGAESAHEDSHSDMSDD